MFFLFAPPLRSFSDFYRFVTGSTVVSMKSAKEITLSGHSRWTTIGLATSTGLLGLTLTGGLTMLAHRLVDQFSRPHTLLDPSAFSWRVPNMQSEPEPSYQRTLLFETSDGTLLRGDFWAQPQVAPTVVLCHGYRVSRAHLRSVAALEYQCGYNVLFFDFRGHGESESVMTSGGNAEVRDLEAALIVASRQPETLKGYIIIHGFSMGAAVALLTPPHSDVVAIIADSPYARLDDILRRIVCYQLFEETQRWRPLKRVGSYLFPPLAWIVVALSTIVFRLRYGFNFVARPEISFRRWKTQLQAALQSRSIPLLLIHSADDDLIPIEHARQLEATARRYGIPLETHFVDGGKHCGAYGYDPRLYNGVIKDFLIRHLKEAFPEKHHAIDIIDQ